MSKQQRIATVGLFAVGALLGARGCGGVTDARVNARNAAAKATCDRLNACGDIPNATYADYPSCITIWQGNWEQTWPSTTCNGTIDQAQLNVCLSAIAATECMGLDVLATLLKCSAAAVCSAATPDAGG